MNKYTIRFNRSKGEPGRGSPEHAWRVFENEQEYIVKNVKINVPSWGEKTGADWSICCFGFMSIEKESSTIIITEK
jgi:hypothetical protein